jgi:hypothetical protein
MLICVNVLFAVCFCSIRKPTLECGAGLGDAEWLWNRLGRLCVEFAIWSYCSAFQPFGIRNAGFGVLCCGAIVCVVV